MNTARGPCGVHRAGRSTAEVVRTGALVVDTLNSSGFEDLELREASGSRLSESWFRLRPAEGTDPRI